MISSSGGEHVSRKRIDSPDAGRRAAGPRPQAVQGHDDERSRSTGRRQSARPPVSRRSAPISAGSATRPNSCIGEQRQAYLAAVLDLFSRFVVGWAISAVNDRHLTIKALEMALKRRCPDLGLLHHSDQGCTYASEDYQDVLDAHGITCSMSRRGNCYDNAVMESFFSTVKSEMGDRFASHGEAKMELFDYIEVFYNQRRRHSSLARSVRRRSNEDDSRSVTKPSTDSDQCHHRSVYCQAAHLVPHARQSTTPHIPAPSCYPGRGDHHSEQARGRMSAGRASRDARLRWKRSLISNWTIDNISGVGLPPRQSESGAFASRSNTLRPAHAGPPNIMCEMRAGGIV